MRIIRSILTVGGFTGLSRLFGLVREVLISNLLAATPIADAFFVAFKFPNFFRRIFGEGAFNVSFVPLFARKLVSDGKEPARLLSDQVFAVMFTFLTIFVALVVIFTPSIIHIMAPGFESTPERLELAITFTRITFPYILFISLAAHLSGVLNSCDRFAAAAGVPIILNVMMIGSLLIAPHVNIPYGIALSSAVLIAGILQMLWLYFACWRMGFHIRFCWPRITPEVRQLFRLMGPGAIGAGVMNINFLIDTMIASYLPEGSISYIFYADRLNQLPLSMFGIAIGTALLPTLSRQLRAGEEDKAYGNKLLATEFALQLTIPAAVGLAVISHPLIHLIYGKFGGLSLSETLATAHALAAFAIGIPAYVLNKIFITGFFARQDTKTPVKVACACIVVNVALSVSLMNVLSHVALALSTSLSSWVNTLILYVILKRKGWFSIPQDLMKTIGIILVNSVVMGFILWEVNKLFQDAPETLGMAAIHVTLSVIIGIGVVGTLGILFKTLNIHNFKQALSRNS